MCLRFPHPNPPDFHPGFHLSGWGPCASALEGPRPLVQPRSWVPGPGLKHKGPGPCASALDPGTQFRGCTRSLGPPKLKHKGPGPWCLRALPRPKVVLCVPQLPGQLGTKRCVNFRKSGEKSKTHTVLETGSRRTKLWGSSAGPWAVSTQKQPSAGGPDSNTRVRALVLQLWTPEPNSGVAQGALGPPEVKHKGPGPLCLKAGPRHKVV